MAHEAALMEASGFLQVSTGWMWPTVPVEQPWLAPPEYVESPVVQLLGKPRVAHPDDLLKEELIACFAGLDEKVFDYEEQYGCDFKTYFYDRCCVAGATYQTWSSETSHRRVRSVISVRWIDDATGENKTGLGILLKIMKLCPFPDIECQMNGVFMRLYMFDEINAIASGVTRCQINFTKRYVWPMLHITPINHVVVREGENRFIIIDVEKQYV